MIRDNDKDNCKYYKDIFILFTIYGLLAMDIIVCIMWSSNM